QRECQSAAVVGLDGGDLSAQSHPINTQSQVVGLARGGPDITNPLDFTRQLHD
ncbi:hypothetical protein ACLOJK_006400, partial [Asimina triloba]